MSRNHNRLDPRRWAAVRNKAMERAGYRSELSGMAGRLEVDHVIPLHRGGAEYDLSNVQVLTRAEHVEKTRAENRREPTPAESAWRELVAEMLD